MEWDESRRECLQGAIEVMDRRMTRGVEEKKRRRGGGKEVKIRIRWWKGYRLGRTRLGADSTLRHRFSILQLRSMKIISHAIKSSY